MVPVQAALIFTKAFVAEKVVHEFTPLIYVVPPVAEKLLVQVPVVLIVAIPPEFVKLLPL